MDSHLNESHVCLMKNWSTFRKMKASAEEVEEHILEIAKTVAVDILRQYGPLLESGTSKLEKDRHLEFRPVALVNFRQQGIVLFNFGIEGIELDEIFRTDAGGWFQAYLYAPNRDRGEHQAIFSSL